MKYEEPYCFNPIDFSAVKLKKTTTTVTSVSGAKTVYQDIRDLSTGSDAGISNGFVVDTKPDPAVCLVVEGLFIGSQDAAHNHEDLAKHRVTHVVNAATGIANADPARYIYYNVEILDVPEAEIGKELPGCVAFIHSARLSGNGVLVHCNAGISRSATVVLAYLIWALKWDLSEAFAALKKSRPAVRPNEGFLLQLEAWQLKCKAE